VDRGFERRWKVVSRHGYKACEEEPVIENDVKGREGKQSEKTRLKTPSIKNDTSQLEGD